MRLLQRREAIWGYAPLSTMAPQLPSGEHMDSRSCALSTGTAAQHQQPRAPSMCDKHHQEPNVHGAGSGKPSHQDRCYRSPNKNLQEQGGTGGSLGLVVEQSPTEGHKGGNLRGGHRTIRYNLELFFK